MTEELKAVESLIAENEIAGADAESSIPFTKFLEEFPLNSAQKVDGYFEFYGRDNNVRKLAPQLKLWCDGDDCQGYRRFDGEWKNKYDIGTEGVARDYLIYRCRDCNIKEKTFCLLSGFAAENGQGHVLKVGEFPDIHIDIPSYLPKLLGDEYPYFIKGLKCEKQGFGIAAFSYYRRVVENQKGRMFASMADAARKLNLADEVISALTAASHEQQFSRAIDDVKHFVPAAFQLNGHNPMKILHSILSDGVHDRTDDECLAMAHDIRIVLQDMSQRIKDALRDDAEARESLSNLMKLKAIK